MKVVKGSVGVLRRLLPGLRKKAKKGSLIIYGKNRITSKEILEEKAKMMSNGGQKFWTFR